MATSQSDSGGQVGGRRYRHLFEHAPICIFIIDLTVSPPTILEVNRRAELVYGYPAAELVGMAATHLVPEEARPAAVTIVRRVQQGETVTAESTHRRRDGTRFPVHVVATLDPTDNSQVIVTVEDITAQKQRRSEAEAIASERLRIAQEIHDGVAQSLAGLRFKSALWSHLADAAPPACAPRWTSCKTCSSPPSPTSAAPSLPCARWIWRRWVSFRRCRVGWETLAIRTS